MLQATLDDLLDAENADQGGEDPATPGSDE